MKLTQISMVLAICRGILCVNDSPTVRPDSPPHSSESSSFSSACLDSNSGQDSRLPSKVLRISGCVRGQTTGLTKDPNRTTNVFVIAVHDENTFCTGTMELKDQVPQGQFEYDVSISDRSFSWPVFIDICRGEEFDSCRLVKVVSPDGGTHGDQHRSFIDKDVGQRQPLTAARLMTSSSSGNETATVRYQVYVDLCNPSSPTQRDHDDKHQVAAKMTPLLYRKMSKNRPKTVMKRTKRQTNEGNAVAPAADMEYNADERMTGVPSVDSVRRIPAQFANNRRGDAIRNNRLELHSSAAAAPATVVRRKWKPGASMQWIRKKSADSASTSDDDMANEENDIVDEEYQKRKWAKNGMGWIKRKWNKPGMGWLKRGEEEKRKWKSNAGMKWV